MEKGVMHIRWGTTAKLRTAMPESALCMQNRPKTRSAKWVGGNIKVCTHKHTRNASTPDSFESFPSYTPKLIDHTPEFSYPNPTFRTMQCFLYMSLDQTPSPSSAQPLAYHPTDPALTNPFANHSTSTAVPPTTHPSTHRTAHQPIPSIFPSLNPKKTS